MALLRKTNFLWKRDLFICSKFSPISSLRLRLKLTRFRSTGSNYPAIFRQLQEFTYDYENINNNVNITPPEYFNFASDIFDQWSHVDSNVEEKRLAYWFVYKDGREIKWTYEDLTIKSKKAANALKNFGAGTKWKRCLVVLPKMPEWWLINLACMRLGVILIPSSPQITGKDLEYRLKSSMSECILTTAKYADVVDSFQSESKFPDLNTKILVDPAGKPRNGWENFTKNYDNASEQHECVKTKSSDIMQIFFTSGTTSLPKKVVQPHSFVLGFHVFGRYRLRLDHNKIFWNIADTGWAKTVWSSIIAPWISGAIAFVHEMPTFDVGLTLDILRDYPIDVLCAPPTVYRMLVANPLPTFKSLENCISGGEPLNPEVMKKWKFYTGLTIKDGFGQTETPPLISNSSFAPIKPGSMGKAMAGVEVDIVDDNGNVLPIGEKGNIAVKVKPNRPIGLFVGYENDPEKNAKCFVGDYYFTGDLAHKDEDGYFWYEGRADDIITSSAYRIGPFEVESALQEHPDVLESAVVGVPDPQRTQIVKAFIVLKETGKKKNPDELKKEIQDHVKRVTAPYKYPRQIEFVDLLPKTISGKIKRAELRKRNNASKEKLV